MATAEYEGSRTKVRRFINAAEDREIIFVKGTTDGINLVAASYGRDRVGAGDEIVISEMEHHSNIVPWQVLCEQTGAVLKVVAFNEDGELLIDEYERILGPRTKLVSMAHTSNALGTVNPVKTIIEMAHSPEHTRTYRCGAGRASWPGGRARHRLRLPGVFLSQGVRADGDGSALRQSGAAWNRCLPTRVVGT